MDCVVCDKCRLNGKVQTRGLATTLKVLFLPSENKSGYMEGLQNQELVSLLQLLAKLSESLSILDEFRQLEQEGLQIHLKVCKVIEVLVSMAVMVLYHAAFRKSNIPTTTAGDKVGQPM